MPSRATTPDASRTAWKPFIRAIELAEGGDPFFLGWVLSETALVYLNEDDVDEAELLLQRALSTLEEIPVRSLPATYKILVARDTLARLHLRSGNPDEVLRLCQLTVPYWRMLAIAHPSVPVYARGYCQALGRSAQARLQLGDEVGARADLDIALQLRDGVAGDDTQWNACDVLDFAEGLGTLGTVERRLGQLSEAKSLFEQGLKTLDEPTNLAAQERPLLPCVFHPSGQSSRCRNPPRHLGRGTRASG